MKPRRARFLLGLVIAGIVLLVASVVVVGRLGPWLIVNDPLVRSDAIFVTDGKTPFRELEGAVLYREGWAPRVVLPLPRTELSEEVRRLSGTPSEQEASSQVLRHAGVPAEAIHRLDRVVENTLQEMIADFDYARSQGFRRVIIASSPYHTRRIRLIWNRHFESRIPAIVRSTRYESVDPSRWWGSRRSVEYVTHELGGILHFFVGSPLPTFGRGG